LTLTCKVCLYTLTGAGSEVMISRQDRNVHIINYYYYSSDEGTSVTYINKN